MDKGNQDQETCVWDAFGQYWCKSSSSKNETFMMEAPRPKTKQVVVNKPNQPDLFYENFKQMKRMALRNKPIP
jgi:hypothetical protein